MMIFLMTGTEALIEGGNAGLELALIILRTIQMMTSTDQLLPLWTL